MEDDEVEADEADAAGSVAADERDVAATEGSEEAGGAAAGDEADMMCRYNDTTIATAALLEQQCQTM